MTSAVNNNYDNYDNNNNNNNYHYYYYYYYYYFRECEDMVAFQASQVIKDSL